MAKKINARYPQFTIKEIVGFNDDYKKQIDPTIIHEPKANEYKHPKQEIALYDIEATASVLTLFSDTNNLKPVDSIKIPNAPSCDGAIFISGDSMYPIIKSGDIIGYKIINDIPQSIFFGNMYLISVNIEGDQMTMVKYIKKGKDQNHVLLVSENKHHADKEISIKNVTGMALVKFSVRYNSLT